MNAHWRGIANFNVTVPLKEVKTSNQGIKKRSSRLSSYAIAVKGSTPATLHALNSIREHINGGLEVEEWFYPIQKWHN